jgi:hypothetical protein
VDEDSKIVPSCTLESFKFCLFTRYLFYLLINFMDPTSSSETKRRSASQEIFCLPVRQL